MVKTSLEKMLEKQGKEAKKNMRNRIREEKRAAEKLKREQERRLKIEMRIQQAASIVNGQISVGNMRVLDKTAEELVSIFSEAYNKNKNMRITNHITEVPDYIQNNISLEFEKLKQYGMISNYTVYINSFWQVDILPCLLTYKEDKENAMKEERDRKSQITIGNIFAENSNVVIGDVINSSISIDNSVKEIQEKIDKEGGTEKEELTELLEEFKEILANIEETRYFPKNKSFMKRLSNHLEKHGWFYAEIVGLLGNVGLMLLGK